MVEPGSVQPASSTIDIDITARLERGPGMRVVAHHTDGLLIQRLRTLALRGTQLVNATAGTIRQRLLKIGAMVTVSTAGFTFDWLRPFRYRAFLHRPIVF
jgi:hypothetical protein